MNCSIYPPRYHLLFLAAALLPLLAAWAYFILPLETIPFGGRVGIGVALAALPVACLVTFLARRPVIRVDDSGISYYPRRYQKIRWPEVVGVERAPLIEPTTDGLLNHGKDGWRPVNVFVRSSDKYQPERGVVADKTAEAMRLQIRFAGLAPVSGEVFECIQRRLAGSS